MGKTLLSIECTATSRRERLGRDPMRKWLAEYVEVNLARLNITGWALMLSSFVIAIGGVVLAVTILPEPAAGEAFPRWPSYLSVFAAVAFFIAGRRVLTAYGISIYRELSLDPDPQESDENATEQMEQGVDYGRIFIGILCALFSVALAILTAFSQDILPNGPNGPFLIAAIIGILAVCLLWPRSPKQS
jgi:hypothetical protein